MLTACSTPWCYWEPVNDLLGHVQFKETRIPIVATAPGRWEPATILAACTHAHGDRVYEVDASKVAPANPNGLDELKIARIVGADGVRPYLSKKSRYFEGRLVGMLPPVARPAEAERCYHWLGRATAGRPTWAFRNLMYDQEGPRTSDYRVRRALRALEDAGLMRIQLGKLGGMATAKCTWTMQAYLPVPAFTLYDEDALAQIAAEVLA